MTDYPDFKEYEKEIHRMGRIMIAIGLLLLFSVPFVFSIILDAKINVKGFINGLLRIVPIYLPSSIVEFLVYVPLLGAGGSYLAFLTGNIINMKLPCAFNAKEIAHTDAGTAENAIISTLSIATSSLVTMLVIFAGVLLLIPLTPVLENPVLKPAFNNVLPALFGALAAQYFVKSWTVTAISLVLMTILTIAIPALMSQTSLMMIPIGGIAILAAWILFKKNKLKENR